MPALTHTQRAQMAQLITERMEEIWTAEGAEGDFADGQRWLRDEAPDEYLITQWATYCPNQSIPAA